MHITHSGLLRVAAVVAAVAIASTAIGQVAPFGGDRIKFPESYDKGVLYTTIDQPDNKVVLDLYATQPAVEAAKAGKALPSGTVLTQVRYKAKLDAQGSPVRDANGRLVKDELVGYAVMEKEAGWGAAVPEDIRNGEWEYQAFKADRTVNDKAQLKRCFECHKPLDKRLDFVFTYDKLAGK
jgi:hypothetical protein